MRFETWYKTDLQRPPQVQTIHGNVFTQDNMGNLVGVRVMKGNAEATLTGTVLGYVIREDGKTVVINGERSGNTAYIVLPESAYAVPGRIQIAIRLINGSTKTVLLAAIGYVTRTTTGTIIDPGEVIPSLDELLAQIDAMEQGTAAANQAASAANTAAANANDKAALADQKATLANTAATNANDKAALADQKATLANTAATNANDKAALADQKATLANTAAEAADLAADAANDATEDAMDAAAAANTAATETSRVNIKQTKSGEVITVTTTDRNGQQTSNTVTDPVTRLLLLADDVPNTVQSIIYGTDGSVSRITHTNNGAAVRTDTFTYGADTITEARVLAAGGSLTMVTNLNTLQTTVTYTSA